MRSSGIVHKSFRKQKISIKIKRSALLILKEIRKVVTQVRKLVIHQAIKGKTNLTKFNLAIFKEKFV